VGLNTNPELKSQVAYSANFIAVPARPFGEDMSLAISARIVSGVIVVDKKKNQKTVRPTD
jgi:hypothetical protein